MEGTHFLLVYAGDVTLLGANVSAINRNAKDSYKYTRKHREN
jgi:hypothetical protein